MTAAEEYTLYWGDLHRHCDVSYGAGSAERAFSCAREQLDFCSITGHAFWPDMPTDRAQYAQVIDAHVNGFARCQENWKPLISLARQVDEPGRFIPFLSYEWHSRASGDHNVYYRDLDGSLVDGPDLDALERGLRQQGAPFMMLPPHIGYRSEAVRVHRAAPRAAYTVEWSGEDRPERTRDWRRLRVAQRNGQWVWTSPIWIVR